MCEGPSSSKEAVPYSSEHGPSTGLSQDEADLHPNHPMRWPSWLRHLCLLQVSYNGGMAGFTSAIIVPGQFVLAEQFHITEQKASYLTSVSVLFLGLGPLLWGPLTDRFGRRSCLIAAMFLSLVSNIGGGYANTYGTLMTARVFQAIGVGLGATLGAPIVVELFPPEERGTKMNVWTVSATTGPALGALVGGFLIDAAGWRWALFLNAISNGVEVLLYVLTFPETQWVAANPIGLKARFGFPGDKSKRLDLMTFLRPFLFVQSPAMVIMLLVYAFSFGIISIGLAITLPAVFIPVYHFTPSTTGLVFVSYIIGALLGGQIGGRLGDIMMVRYARKQKARGKAIRYEYRLWASLPGYFLVVVGLIIYGVTLEAVTQWSGPVVAFGICQAGLQTVLNISNTYCVECYRANALYITAALNLLRQVVGFTCAFWIPPLNESCGFGLGTGILAIILFLLYLLSLIVLWRGERIRNTFPIRGIS